MPDDEHVILETKVHILVRQREGVGVGLGMNHFPLQNILRADAVELGLDQHSFPPILSGKLGRVQRGSNQKAPSIASFSEVGAWPDIAT